MGEKWLGAVALKREAAAIRTQKRPLALPPSSVCLLCTVQLGMVAGHLNIWGRDAVFTSQGSEQAGVCRSQAENNQLSAGILLDSGPVLQGRGTVTMMGTC